MGGANSSFTLNAALSGSSAWTLADVAELLVRWRESRKFFAVDSESLGALLAGGRAGLVAADIVALLGKNDQVSMPFLLAALCILVCGHKGLPIHPRHRAAVLYDIFALDDTRGLFQAELAVLVLTATNACATCATSNPGTPPLCVRGAPPLASCHVFTVAHRHPSLLRYGFDSTPGASALAAKCFDSLKLEASATLERPAFVDWVMRLSANGTMPLDEVFLEKCGCEPTLHGGAS